MIRRLELPAPPLTEVDQSPAARDLIDHAYVTKSPSNLEGEGLELGWRSGESGA